MGDVRVGCCYFNRVMGEEGYCCFWRHMGAHLSFVYVPEGDGRSEERCVHAVQLASLEDSGLRPT